MAIQMTGEQFQQLMQAMAQARIEEGNLADCTHRFNGKRDYHIVEDFITNVTTYISAKHIREQNAIASFGLLLTDDARRWWDGAKTALRSWNDVTTTIRRVFQPPQPNWLLINEIGQDKQAESETTDAYVTRQMSRLTRLIDFPINESQQIDMIYGHMRLKIKKGVPRDTVNSIIQLLDKARTIEQHEQEAKALTPSEPKTCAFCKIKGHVESDCRKKKAMRPETSGSTGTKPSPKPSVPNEEKPSFSCYGCGTPNVVRSKCTTCNKVAKPLPEHKEFYSMNKEIGTDLPRISASIYGHPASTYLDTCARTSIANRELYLHLLNTNHQFKDEIITLKLADGSQNTKAIKKTITTINLGNRTLPIQFIVIPDVTTNETLIGADFIKENNVIPILSENAWCFADKMSEWFSFDYTQTEPNELTDKQNINVNLTPIIVESPQHKEFESPTSKTKADKPPRWPSYTACIIQIDTPPRKVTRSKGQQPTNQHSNDSDSTGNGAIIGPHHEDTNHPTNTTRFEILDHFPFTAYVENCDTCWRHKAQDLQPVGHTRNIETNPAITVNIFGPITPSTEGYRYILITENTDYRMVYLFGMINTSATTYVETLINEAFQVHGTPRIITSDRRIEIARGMKQITDALDIEWYHKHQADPVENYNAELKRILEIYINNNQNWGDHLWDIAYKINFPNLL